MATLNAANCETAFDNRTRQLYATDASHYQIVPGAVAFPKTAKEAAAAFQAAALAGISVTPRGAGTGLCFGPEVATSSRATLGGMIANNSSGHYTPV